MNGKILSFKLSCDELQTIDQARKQTGESRSAFIRRKLFAADAPLEMTEISKAINRLSAKIENLKENELNTINRGYKLLNTYNVTISKWIIKFILHVIDKRKFSEKEIAWGGRFLVRT